MKTIYDNGQSHINEQTSRYKKTKDLILCIDDILIIIFKSSCSII